MSELLDQRICDRCPLGPVAMAHDVCNRCIADAVAIRDRNALAESLEHKLVYDGVEYAKAILYLVLPNLLPRYDPATVKEPVH